MPYNPGLAFTNAQQRDDNLRNALGDFMTFFKTRKAQADEEAKTTAQADIIKASGAAQDSTTGAPRLGMDAAGMPTGMKGEGVEPGQAAQRHLADIKAQYLMKYGQMPATGQDMLAADLDREDKIAGYGDNRDARTAKKAQAGKVEAFGKAIGADTSLSQTERDFYGIDPKAYGERLKPASNIIVPSLGGINVVPSRGPATATPLKDEAGAPLMPPKPPTAPLTPEQIEANAAAAARGKASVEKPMTEKDTQVVQMKLASLASARRQLQDVKTAHNAAKQSMLSGKGRGWLPTKENAALEKAVAALKPTIAAMTRVPGIGSMSDFEAKLDAAKYPEPGEYGEVNDQAITSLESLINETETGYKGLGKPTEAAGTVWRRAKDGKEYEYDANSKQPTGNSR